jgi:hypothetical protein
MSWRRRGSPDVADDPRGSVSVASPPARPDAPAPDGGRSRLAELAARAVAGCAGLAVLAGAVTMTIALVAAPGPWTTGYVSEAGTAGTPFAATYRGGLLLLAAGVVALGAALVRAARAAALLLGPAGLLAGVSGAVPCSAGCPLPPYQVGTPANLAHTATSVAGMAALGFAMVALAAAPAAGSALRRTAVVAAAATLPLAAAEALAMLLVGRAPLTGAVERALLVVAVCWLLGTALLRTRPRLPDER